MEIEIKSEKLGSKCFIIDDEDYDKIKEFKWHLWTTVRHRTIYVLSSNTKTLKSVRLHRLIMNAKPGEVVDHINGNALDNRKCNLRLTDSFGNNQNAQRRKTNKSGHKGVSFITASRKWLAQIQVRGKGISLGLHSTREEAAKAYNEGALKYFGQFAVLNKPY